MFAAAYDRAGARRDPKAQEDIVDAYISHLEAVTAYYEQQSIAIVGRGVRQILLIHASALNAATLDRLASMHRWAMTDGKRSTIFAGEPPVPEWIEQASR